MKKRIRCVLCTAVLALMLCTSAMAAGPADLNIEYNGEPLTFTDAAPKIVSDRTYLPFRAVFTALGFADENITYASDTRTVTAMRENLEVSMVIGENKVTVIRDGKATVLDTDVPAFIDPAVNRTFVPVSFVAQAVGYRVVWNGETRTVFIDDVEGILAGNQETYKLLDQYLAYSRKIQSKNYAVDGTFAASIGIPGEGMGMNGTYSMLTAGHTKFDFDMRMQLSGMVDGVDMNMVLPEGIGLSMRGDMSAGEFYFKSDMQMTTMETGAESVWFKMDMEDTMGSMADMPGMNYMDVLDMRWAAAEKMDGKTMVYTLAQVDTTLSVADQLAVYNALLGDSAFEKKGSGYVNVFAAEGMEMTVTFHTSGKQVAGYCVAVSAAQDGAGTKMEVSIKGNVMRAVYEILSDGTVVTMNLEGIYTATRKLPAGVPDKDAVIMDLTQSANPVS